MLINLSNQAFEEWDELKQRIAYEQYGSISNLLLIETLGIVNHKELENVADKLLDECLYLLMLAEIPVSQAAENNAIYLQDEGILEDRIISLLYNHGISCVYFRKDSNGDYIFIKH